MGASAPSRNFLFEPIYILSAISYNRYINKREVHLMTKLEIYDYILHYDIRPLADRLENLLAEDRITGGGLLLRLQSLRVLFLQADYGTLLQGL